MSLFEVLELFKLGKLQHSKCPRFLESGVQNRSHYTKENYCQIMRLELTLLLSLPDNRIPSSHPSSRC